MKMYFFLMILFLFVQELNAQQNTIVEQSIVFKDTVNQMVTDSCHHDFGNISQYHPSRLKKYFKYIGTKKINILRAWTGDPHYICSYPKEELIPGKVYCIEICFYFKGRIGAINKKMGLIFSDETRLDFTFKANIFPE